MASHKIDRNRLIPTDFCKFNLYSSTIYFLAQKNYWFSRRYVNFPNILFYWTKPVDSIKPETFFVFLFFTNNAITCLEFDIEFYQKVLT